MNNLIKLIMSEFICLGKSNKKTNRWLMSSGWSLIVDSTATQKLGKLFRQYMFFGYPNLVITSQFLANLKKRVKTSKNAA